MPDNGKLSAEQVRSLVKELADQPGFQQRNTLWRNRRLLRHRLAKVGVPRVREEVEYRTPWLDEEVHRWANRCIGAPIRIKATAKKAKDDGAAQRVENFFYRCYWDFRRVRTAAFVNADQRAADHKCGDGLGIRHVRLSPQALDMLVSGKKTLQDMERGFEGLPFVLEAPDPITVYYEPDLSLVCEEGDVTFRKLRGLYPDLGYSGMENRYHITSEPMDITYEKAVYDKTCRVYHVETPLYVYDLMVQPDVRESGDNALVLNSYKNPFHRPAYAFDPGHITGADEPGYAYEPLIGGLYGIAAQWNVLGTLRQAAGVWTGVPMYYLARQKGRTGDDPGDYMTLPSGEKKEFHFNWETGEVEGIPEGYEPVPVKFETGIDLTAAIQDLRSEMDRYSMRDIAEVQATSGYDRARIIEATGFDLQPALDNQAACWHEIFLLIAEGVKELGVPVTVQTIPQRGDTTTNREVTVKPDDFKDIDLAVLFPAIGLSARFALVESGLRQLETDRISETTFMSEYQGTDDVERERRMRDRDNLRKIVRGRVGAILDQVVDYVAMADLRAALPDLFPPTTPPAEAAPEPAKAPGGNAGPGTGAPLVQAEPPKPMGPAPNEGVVGQAGF